MEINIIQAYKKFKSHIYNDNTLLHVRILLAEFENQNNFEEKLKKFQKLINDTKIDNLEFIQPYLEQIKFIITPKKITSANNLPSNIFINEKSLPSYHVEEFNIFIDCPIEIHLISVLWILHVGHKLDEELETNIHGYRLSRNSDKNIEENSYKLFEKYHERYLKFRDGALKKAIDLHEHNLDTTLINLDIKSFFYNIKFNFEKECAHVIHDNIDNVLNRLMDMIHTKYKTVLQENQIKSHEEIKKIIPIGLLSSSIIANYTLKEFDKLIVQDVKPAFYSRYVDDMLIVLTNIKLDNSETNIIHSIFKNCIFKQVDFNFDNENISFQINKNTFTFQNSKIKVFHFYKNDSIHLLEKFSKTITKNSSLFKLLPEDKEIFNTLEEASYNITYSSTINKVSSINGNSLDILNISRNIVQMTHIIMSTKYSQDEIKKYNTQIENIFVGTNILELQRLWEKIFTYLFISKSQKEFIKLSKRIIKVITSIKYEKNDIIELMLMGNLAEYFVNSISMAISLYPSDFEQNFLDELKNIYSKAQDTKLLEHLSIEFMIPRAKQLRKSNLIRHYMTSSIPLLNYCKHTENISFYDKNISINNFNFEIDESQINFSPRFIHYHELSIFFHLKFLHDKMSDEERNNYISNQEKFIFDMYHLFNKTPQSEHHYPKKIEQEDSDNGKDYHHIPSKSNSYQLRIGLINTEVNIEDSIQSFLGKPNLSFNRLLDVFEVLNSAKKNNCDIVVFPEISIPYYWLKRIADFSKLNNIAIIFGMEHFTINKKVYNYSVAILPFQVNKYTNAFIHFNLKSHYSPNEVQAIEGRYFEIPEGSSRIDIYRWQGSVFSIFNCYELTNIQARGKLVGENDFTVAIEFNSDTTYFSNIVGSIARDNHTYVVQVNSSKYGDSRITQPTKSETMDIVKIKGGKNTTLIVGEININKLRDFQSKTHTLQMIDQEKDKFNSFKLTPPNFKISKYRE